jgi:ribosomal protein S18 acetylase RimI-like enzyme
MIRLMTERDLLRCHDITRINWNEEVADRTYRQMEYAVNASYLGPKTFFYVYEEDGEVVAYAGMMQSWIMSGVWDFIWVNVHPDFRRKGIGDLLTIHRIAEVKKIGGSVINLMTKEYPFFEPYKFRINRVIDGWAHMSLQLKELTI